MMGNELIPVKALNSLVNLPDIDRPDGRGPHLENGTQLTNCPGFFLEQAEKREFDGQGCSIRWEAETYQVSYSVTYRAIKSAASAAHPRLFEHS